MISQPNERVRPSGGNQRLVIGAWQRTRKRAFDRRGKSIQLSGRKVVGMFGLAARLGLCVSEPQIVGRTLMVFG